MYIYTSYLSSTTLSGQLIGIDVRSGLIDLFNSGVVQRYPVSKIVGPVYVADKRYNNISRYMSSLITTSFNNFQDLKNNNELRLKSQSPAQQQQRRRKQPVTEEVQEVPVQQKNPSVNVSSNASSTTTDSEQESSIHGSEQEPSSNKILNKSRQLRLELRRKQRKPVDSKVPEIIKPLKTNVLKGFVRESDEVGNESSTSNTPSSDSTMSLRNFWDVIERRGSPTGKTSSERYADLRVAEFDKKVDRLVTTVIDLCTAVKNITPAPALVPATSQSSSNIEQRPPIMLQFHEMVLQKRTLPIPNYASLFGRFEDYTEQRFITEFKAAKPLDVVIDFTVYLCLSLSEAKARVFNNGCKHVSANTKPGVKVVRQVYGLFKAALV